jgi:uncharacterized cupredoxin-like copper-binding protein
MSRRFLIGAVIVVIAAVALALALTRESIASSSGTFEPPVVTLVATDFGFETPETIPAGAVTIRLVNQGIEPHHGQLVRLDEGKTLDDMAASFERNEVPKFATWVGGPGLVAPGMESSVTLALRPGTYYWLCFIESSDRVPHMAKGMVRPITVESGAGGTLPTATNTMMLNDYDFKLAQPLRSGTQVIRVRNYAAQAHEVTVMRFAPGKTMEDVQAWMEAGASDEPPAVPVGGMQALSPGLAGNLELTLQPGEYLLICFVPDSGDFQPHVAHGMVQAFSVS